MLHLLPTEIALESLSYLPLHSLCIVPQVSRQWHDIFAANESSIYHKAAVLHHFAPSAVTSLSDSIKSYPERSLIGVKNWKAFCQKRWQVERAWMGRGPSTYKEIKASGHAVHRIKVDERLALVITTFQHGGLYVTDLKSSQVLWSLGQLHVVRYAHCEYSNGFLIFNRHDNCKEVWRLSSDYPPDLDPGDLPTPFPPDDQMLRASNQAAHMFSSPTNRGHFKPWSLLQMPEMTRAFRFVYPTLLSTAVNNAYMWDVPTSKLVQSITGIQAVTPDTQSRPLGRINYVEVNDRYAFICGSQQLRVFSKEGGALVFSLSPEHLVQSRQWHVLWPGDAPSPVQDNILAPNPVSLVYPSYSGASAGQNHFGALMAVHVSSSGRDLVALSTYGLLLIIRDFERVVTKEIALADALTQINFNPQSRYRDDFSIYLAFEYGKIGLATRRGIFVLALDSDIHTATSGSAARTPTTSLPLSVCRVVSFDTPKLLPFISCLQITDTGLYFNWEPTPTPSARPENNNENQAPVALQVDVFHDWMNGGAGGGNGEAAVVATTFPEFAGHAHQLDENDEGENGDEGGLDQNIPALEPISPDAGESSLLIGSDSIQAEQAPKVASDVQSESQSAGSPGGVDEGHDVDLSGEMPALASIDDESDSDDGPPDLQLVSDSSDSDEGPQGAEYDGILQDFSDEEDEDEDDEMDDMDEMDDIIAGEAAIELFAQWVLGESLSTVYSIDFLPSPPKKCR
ncbi:hypothetical protein SERLA73DRAFT_117516 [Serpula lacrymans var. lacrymans S7.3]|uniref:F-box domain-containing protein n=1 Tax=Serpula lacrymans var. lacrymans (strain S7.3) TaxID=936435 RepID=F8QH84_SERL3|nr:hypothetical protein SERLA73DRAFT_117516 [Serpula lacrymans var. lacrymans S7.3]